MKKVKIMIVALVLAFVMAIPTIFAQPFIAAESTQSTPEEMGLIPIRHFFEDIGGILEWNDEDRSIHIIVDGGKVVLFADQMLAYTNEVAVILQYGISLWQDRSFITEHDLMLLLESFLESRSTTITFYLTEEARDIALYDFEYMITAILENSPWDSVLDRSVLDKMELDFYTYASIFRGFIKAMEPLTITVLDEELLHASFPIKTDDDARSIAANYLFALLAFEFAPPLMNIGHLGPRTLSMYTSQLTGFLRQYHDIELDSEKNLLLSLLIDTYTHPSTVWFYGETDVDLDVDARAAFPNVPGNIVAEVLIPDEVAFLRINCFLANPEYDDLIILPFLQEVQDFNHLILDVRGNLGGLVSYFNEFILRRLIDEPVEIGTHEFFSNGSIALGVMDATVQTMLQMESIFYWSEIIYAEIMPVNEFIAERGMQQFNPDDLARLDYVMVSRSVISPAYDINFGGKVWLLVDDMSMSASALAAEAALYTGFATVVGENTSGVMGSSHAYVALPNTGIIWRVDIGYKTDALGRSLEVYGIEPQILNNEGMDALETVLALIAYGDY